MLVVLMGEDPSKQVIFLEASLESQQKIKSFHTEGLLAVRPAKWVNHFLLPNLSKNFRGAHLYLWEDFLIVVLCSATGAP